MALLIVLRKLNVIVPHAHGNTDNMRPQIEWVGMFGPFGIYVIGSRAVTSSIYRVRDASTTLIDSL